jgi:predicted MFS family arabinose efflux permease
VFDGWRGTMFLICISGALLLVIVIITLPETNFKKIKSSNLPQFLMIM